MKIKNRKGHIWKEFTRDRAGCNVALNTTGFHHSHLLFDYALAYRKAARTLFERFQDSKQIAMGMDMDMHPVIFLYRHAVELHLKTLALTGNGLLWINGDRPIKTTDIFKAGHSLKKLLPDLARLFQLLDDSHIWISQLLNSFKDVERLVNALDEVPHDAFRYPIDSSGKAELLPYSLGFTDFEFVEKIESLAGVLEAATRSADDKFQKYFQNSNKRRHMPS